MRRAQIYNKEAGAGEKKELFQRPNNPEANATKYENNGLELCKPILHRS